MLPRGGRGGRAARNPAGVVAVLALQAAEAMLPPSRIEALVAPFLGGDDPVFGFLSGLTLPQFFDPDGWRIARRKSPPSPGTGADRRLRRAARRRGRHSGLCRPGPLGGPKPLPPQRDRAISASRTATLAASLQYKRAFFVDWRVADRWKRPLIAQWDFVLDTNNPREPKLAEGEAVRRGLAPGGHAAVPRGAVFRSGALGRAMDEGGLRPRPQRAELRLVLRLRAGREQPAARALARRALRDSVD